MAKSWIEKLSADKKKQVKVIDKAFADIPAGGRMLIATPKIVEEYVNNIPEGHHTDIKTIRNDLAIEYNAEYTCPVTTGIFLRTVAEAAHEMMQQGKNEDDIPPYWRTMDEKSKLAKKLSVGTEFLIQKRREEGLL